MKFCRCLGAYQQERSFPSRNPHVHVKYGSNIRDWPTVDESTSDCTGGRTSETPWLGKVGKSVTAYYAPVHQCYGQPDQHFDLKYNRSYGSPTHPHINGVVLMRQLMMLLTLVAHQRRGCKTHTPRKSKNV